MRPDAPFTSKSPSLEDPSSLNLSRSRQRYGCIYADPPWNWQAWSQKGEGRSAKNHYDVLAHRAIAELPVGELAAPDSALFLWVTNPLLPVGLHVMAAWGFTYKTVAYVWAKRTKTDNAWHMGTGYWTRANAELCLLGTRGKPKRQNMSERMLIVSPVREHSRKPDAVRESIQRLVPGPYLELFARSRAPGWSSWGDEVCGRRVGLSHGAVVPPPEVHDA